MFDNLRKLQFDKISSSFSGEVIDIASDVKQFNFPYESSQWDVIHNYNTENVIVQTFNATNELIIPANVVITNNYITITFSTEVSGFANVLVIDGELSAMNEH